MTKHVCQTVTNCWKFVSCLLLTEQLFHHAFLPCGFSSYEIACIQSCIGHMSILLFSSMQSLVFLEIPSLSGRIVTLITVILLSTTVHKLVSFEVPSLFGRIAALITRIGCHTAMNLFVSFEVRGSRKRIVALVARKRLGFWVNDKVLLELLSCFEVFITLRTVERSFLWVD